MISTTNRSIEKHNLHKEAVMDRMEKLMSRTRKRMERQHQAVHVPPLDGRQSRPLHQCRLRQKGMITTVGRDFGQFALEEVERIYKDCRDTGVGQLNFARFKNEIQKHRFCDICDVIPEVEEPIQEVSEDTSKMSVLVEILQRKPASLTKVLPATVPTDFSHLYNDEGVSHWRLPEKAEKPPTYPNLDDEDSELTKDDNTASELKDSGSQDTESRKDAQDEDSNGENSEFDSFVTENSEKLDTSICDSLSCTISEYSSAFSVLNEARREFDHSHSYFYENTTLGEILCDDSTPSQYARYDQVPSDKEEGTIVPETIQGNYFGYTYFPSEPSLPEKPSFYVDFSHMNENLARDKLAAEEKKKAEEAKRHAEALKILEAKRAAALKEEEKQKAYKQVEAAIRCCAPTTPFTQKKTDPEGKVEAQKAETTKQDLTFVHVKMNEERKQYDQKITESPKKRGRKPKMISNAGTLRKNVLVKKATEVLQQKKAEEEKKLDDIRKTAEELRRIETEKVKEDKEVEKTPAAAPPQEKKLNYSIHHILFNLPEKQRKDNEKKSEEPEIVKDEKESNTVATSSQRPPKRRSASLSACDISDSAAPSPSKKKKTM